MFIKAATRNRLTSSLFSTTFLIALATVSVSHFLPCPVTHNGVDNDSKDTKTRARMGYNERVQLRRELEQEMGCQSELTSLLLSRINSFMNSRSEEESLEDWSGKNVVVVKSK